MTTAARITTLVVLLLALSALAFGQSLLDDPQYKALVDQVDDLQAQAQQAIDDGRYDDAVTLSEQAEEVAQDARTYAEQRVLAYRANGWINVARQRIAYADAIDAANRYPDEYARATGHIAEAQTHFSNANYANAINSAKLVMSDLQNITPPTVAQPEAQPASQPVAQPEPEPEPEPVVEPEPEPEPQPVVAPAPQGPVLPRYYVVRLIPQRRDCFWRIAGYDFVYGDPWQWRVLYEANKDRIPDPDNPDLILPGMVIEIPSIDGETRSGTWDPEGSN